MSHAGSLRTWHWPRQRVRTKRTTHTRETRIAAVGLQAVVRSRADHDAQRGLEGKESGHRTTELQGLLHASVPRLQQGSPDGSDEAQGRPARRAQRQR